MAINMPQVEITFRQQAASLMERSERGYAILIARDSTQKELLWKRYDDLTALEADKACYTAENYAAISDPLAFAPFRTYAATLPEDGLLADALELVQKKVKTGWITVVNMTPEDAVALSSWIKAQEKKFKSYKAVVYKPTTAPDSMHVVNFGNETITFADERGEQSGVAYLPSLTGILAVCNVTQGSTNFACSNLIDVEETADNDKALNDGLFILTHDDDDGVMVANGVNSLTTTNGQTLTEDMRYIETVEAMDLIRDDIARTFRQEWQGKYRNEFVNQMLLISSLNHSYFAGLAQEGILDPNYTNAAEIDVQAQRQAWLATGKVEAADWDDATVKQMSFKRSVFLSGHIKIANSMTDLFMQITLM